MTMSQDLKSLGSSSSTEEASQAGIRDARSWSCLSDCVAGPEVHRKPTREASQAVSQKGELVMSRRIVI